MASASSLGREYLSGSLASCTTAALFSPLECVKTRLQLQDMPGWRRIYTRGFLHALQQIYRQDGLLLLWSHGFAGLVARDFFYSGMRTGMYPTVRGLIAPGRAPGDISLAEKILAGAHACSEQAVRTDDAALRRHAHSHDIERVGEPRA